MKEEEKCTRQCEENDNFPATTLYGSMKVDLQTIVYSTDKISDLVYIKS